MSGYVNNALTNLLLSTILLINLSGNLSTVRTANTTDGIYTVGS